MVLRDYKFAVSNDVGSGVQFTRGIGLGHGDVHGALGAAEQRESRILCLVFLEVLEGLGKFEVGLLVAGEMGLSTGLEIWLGSLYMEY